MKRWVVHQMTIAQEMKSAISYQGLVQEKSANLYVYLERVLREQAVKL